MPVIGPILKHNTELGKHILPDKISKPHKIVIESEFHYEDLENYY